MAPRLCPRLCIPMKPIMFLLACCPILAADPLQHLTLPANNPHTVLTRFAFGACWKHNRSQKHWDSIIANKPQFWLWLGDNIYGDSNDMEVLRTKYGRLANTPGYRRLASTIPVLATWDDHDYGKNDAGCDYPMRAQSQKVFLEFFNERADSPRRKRPGVYTSYYLGPAHKRVQIILLDTRYFRTPLKRIKGKPPYPRMGRYTPDHSSTATMLGETQWQWLESELQKQAKIRIIATSIQFSAPHNGYETWANMPGQKQRMIDLIKKTRAEGVIFLSGDIHSSELCIEEPEGCYSLHDHTSSSLNVPLGAAATHRRTGPAFGGANFGLVEIDWSKPDPLIHFSTKDHDNLTRIHHRVPLSSLTFAEKNLIWSTQSRDFAGEWHTLHGLLTLKKLDDNGNWIGTCAARKLTLTESKFGLAGTWQGNKQHGRVTLTLSRNGKFLNGACSYGNLPLQLDWAGWKIDWEKHFTR